MVASASSSAHAPALIPISAISAGIKILVFI
jgi:hypothetical protein